ncbi:MAG: heme A synthase [Gammaproteobacteria bacterium]|nr:heme A synthase [Gammaproteobacteria bacterium]
MINPAIFTRLSLAAFLLALVVIVVGAYVRLSDAGLGCPDWPGCYGQLVAPDEHHEIKQAMDAFPEHSVDSGKAWKEMVHRYLASTLGFLILIMAWIAWRNRGHQQQFYVPLILVGLVIFQGMLGMWTVTLLLKPTIVTLHLLTGLLTLSLLFWVWMKQNKTLQQTLITGRSVSNGLLFWARAGLLMLALQIFLGGWTSTNYVALYCPDFPTCQGAWWPEMKISEAYVFFRESGVNYEGGTLSNAAGMTVHTLHRVGALLTFLLISAIVISVLSGVRLLLIRRVAYWVMVLLLLQLGLGIANVLLRLPLALAVAHNAGAALLLLAMLRLNFLLHYTNKNRV